MGAAPNRMPIKALVEEARVRVLGTKLGLPLRELRRRPLTKSELIRRERENAGGATVCHIVGSGWSLAESLGSILPGDYVVGYNLAALTGRRFDSYHMERIDERAPGINDFYRAMMDGSGQDRRYIKNLYERRAMPRVINDYLDHGCTAYRTFEAGGYFKLGQERALANYLLDGGGRFLLQYKSSVMLFAVLYARVGFREIVLHGQDLSGPYFFDVADFPLARELKPRACGVLPKEIPPLSKTHQINRAFRNEPRIGDVLPAMVEVLRERGVSLSCASASSPIAEFVPVHQAGN